jgi:hypothetical protein
MTFATHLWRTLPDVRERRTAEPVPKGRGNARRHTLAAGSSASFRIEAKSIMKE